MDDIIPAYFSFFLMLTVDGHSWREAAVIEWAKEGNICALRSLPHREMNESVDVHFTCFGEAAKRGRAEICEFFVNLIINESTYLHESRTGTLIQFCIEANPQQFHRDLAMLIREVCLAIGKGDKV